MFCSRISSHMALFMIRYGEIALKSPRVRIYFERTLGKNITTRFIRAEKECRIEFERGRIFLWADDEDFAAWVLSRTFGIISFSKATETTSVKEDIFATAIELSKPLFRPGIRFCIRARRSGQHEYNSMELGRDVGSAVFLANEHLAPKVDLTHPELEIFVEVRNNRSYIYTGSHPGPGGMPLGTQGRVIGIVKSKRDAAACWLIMKRGCRVMVITDDPTNAELLFQWDPDLKVRDMGELQNIDFILRKYKINGLCLGWDVKTFDQQGSDTANWSVPAFHPLIGMLSSDVEKLIAKISE